MFLDCLREELTREPLNLLDQAEGYRAKQSRKNIEATAQKATDHVAEAVEREVAPLLAREAESPADPPPLPAEVPKSPSRRRRARLPSPRLAAVGGHHPHHGRPGGRTVAPTRRANAPPSRGRHGSLHRH